MSLKRSEMKNALSGMTGMEMPRRLSFTMPQGCILTTISATGRATSSDCSIQTGTLSRVTAMTAGEICYLLKTVPKMTKQTTPPLSVTKPPALPCEQVRFYWTCSIHAGVIFFFPYNRFLAIRIFNSFAF